MTTTEYPLDAYRDRVVSLMPLGQMKLALAELQATRREIDERIDQLQEVLAAWGNGATRRFPPKRQAVLEFLSQRPSRRMALSEIRTELVERGELADTRKAAHALQMTMLKLLKEGILERPEQGVYVLPQHALPEVRRSVAFPSYDAVVFPNRALEDEGARFATPDLQRKEGEA